MNWYERKQEERRERLEERAEAQAKEGQARVQQARTMASAIPFGQPILVGHYSERRDRNYRGKIASNFQKGFEAFKAAEETQRRAEAVGTGGISSDDPEAVRKLKEQLAEFEAEQATMKEANAAWRKAGNKAGRQPDGSWLDGPYASYSLSNNSANIRRVKQRIEFLSRAQTRETTEVEADGFKVIQNTEINRLQFVFPGKPSEKVRGVLKGRGFRWAPSEGAWQRHLTGCAAWFIEQVTKEVQEALKQ